MGVYKAMFLWIGEFRPAVQIFLAALVSALLLANISIALTRRFGIIDEPGRSAHKQHLKATPLAGGITLASVMVLIFVFYGEHFSREGWTILAATLIVFLFGLLDDIRGMGVRGKVLGQSLAAILLISLGIKVSLIGPGLGEFAGAGNILISYIWLLVITNSFNLVDGIDGLAISLGIVSSLFLLIGSIIAQQTQVVNLVSIILGIFLLLLFYNLSPAKLFLGDSGAQSAGFFLAALAILYNPFSPPQGSSWFVPITFFAVPIFDVGLVFFSRVRRGLPFYESDLNHTHHRLVRRGLSGKRAILVMSLAAFGLGLLGLFALYRPPIVANLLFAGIILAGLFSFRLLEEGFEEHSLKK